MIVMEQQQVAGSSEAEDDASSNSAGQKQQQPIKVFLAEPVACYRLESGKGHFGCCDVCCRAHTEHQR